MITGSCLCNAVRWTIDGPLEHMTHCHCSICRKAHGSAFATYIRAPKDGFKWVAGEASIKHYESSPGFHRAFCATCGSVVPEDHGKGHMSVPAGCLNEDPVVRAHAHIFAADKAPWYTITDDLPQFDGYTDPTDGPNIASNSPSPAVDGVLRGSCLCDRVAYEIRGPITVAHNCHCTRCRKARAAAHGSNGFSAFDDLVFLRGEDELITYKLPEARFYAQAFCNNCGSAMPRCDAGRQLAVIPLSSLDDAPTRGPDDHIFVGSKAPWYNISDALPQFDEAPK